MAHGQKLTVCTSCSAGSLGDYCHRNDYSSWGTRTLAVNRCTICSVLALFSLIGGLAFLACSNDFKTPVHLAWNRAISISVQPSSADYDPEFSVLPTGSISRCCAVRCSFC